MAWREALLSRFGPGLLAGVTLGDWVRLLRENDFGITPRCFLRAMSITHYGIQNSVLRRCENWRYGRRVNDVEILPPVFILGHWRSGTTHLHNLLTTDRRFAFPNMYQVVAPHTFLSTEAFGSRMMAFFLPRRRPMDNVEWSMLSPQEDEFALAVTSLRSPYLGWVFPNRREHYDRHLTLRGLPESDVAPWREALLLFLKKLTWKYQRPLVLKSPPHTCRIRLLLEMFPRARFVHIHRNPYAVFQSSRKTFRVNFELSGLQRLRIDDLDEYLLRQYRIMYDAFFEERHLIPAGQYHEIGFEPLELNPMGEMQRLYESLDLPDFSPAEPSLRRYLDSIAGYSKNEFPGLPAELRQSIAGAWRPCFAEWGYPE
ncbi:MAG: sulfotransferase [Planctomycetaceae bacterium]|nr:sulfotransferase [Planctomycetaceae bacterium]